MLNILIIVGSTRPNRKSKSVADWVYDNVKDTDGMSFKVVDLAEVNLPLFDEPMPPMMGQYQNEHTKKWAEVIGAADGYIFVTPEYNHSVPAVLKNAIDFLYAEWGRKPAAFVGYGVANGVRAVEHLKQIAAQLNMAPLSSYVGFNVFQHWGEDASFKPDDRSKEGLDKLVAELRWWGDALQTARQKS
jgi:NAD(P)H-dependent FMN reductase